MERCVRRHGQRDQQLSDGSDRWGNSFFAPYVDMGLHPVPDLHGLARQTLTVAGGTTALNIQADIAEDVVVSYSWGRQLVVTGFDPSRDRLDLRGFWSEGQQAQLVDLGFNQQQITLAGVDIGQLGPDQLVIWTG